MSRRRHCPRCRSRAIVYKQRAEGVVAVLERGLLTFLFEPLSPCGVSARCIECSWEWSLKGVRSLADIGFPDEG